MRLTILGATGSIGQSTLDLVREHRDRFRIEALVANRNVAQLARDAREFGAAIAVTAADELYGELKEHLAGSGIAAAAGSAAVVEAAERETGMVMAAIVGASGLRPTLAAVRKGTAIGLANKECLVCAGDLFMAEAKKHGARVLPVDSEHSAIFQCFEQHNADSVAGITLTASGGPFRQRSRAELETVTVEEALKHPNWSMGRKITIDSATLMNKGLELIEAYHLFPVAPKQLDAVIHPQSIIHSYVSYEDGSVLAQMGMPDMRSPIAYALAHPQRIKTTVEALDLAAISRLTFEPVDRSRFAAIGLCLGALESGGAATAVLNAANEIAVDRFLSKKLPFLGIDGLVARVLDASLRSNMASSALATLDDVIEADSYGRQMALELANGLQAR